VKQLSYNDYNVTTHTLNRANSCNDRMYEGSITRNIYCEACTLLTGTITLQNYAIL